MGEPIKGKRKRKRKRKRKKIRTNEIKENMKIRKVNEVENFF